MMKQLFGPISCIPVCIESKRPFSVTPLFKHRHLRPVLGCYWVLWPCASAAWPPARSSGALSAALSTASVTKHTIRLTEIHNKMSRGSFPTGGNYRGLSWWFRACVCVCFRIPRITGIQGETNEWLAEMAWCIPSVAWKRPKLSH